jgi:hypothetical protein
MQLFEFECPNCGANEMVADESQQLVCVFCNSSFGEVARICPKCGHYNEADVRHCFQCGTRLVRDCPVCGADNWVLADHCVQCGRNMDMLEQMSRRWRATTQQFLMERRATMSSLKEQEERASQERMAAFMETERARQEAIAQAREVQRERDRKLLMAAGVVIVVFALVVVLMLLFAPGSG